MSEDTTSNQKESAGTSSNSHSTLNNSMDFTENKPDPCLPIMYKAQISHPLESGEEGHHDIYIVKRAQLDCTADTALKINKRIAGIVTGTQNVHINFGEVDYTDLPPMGENRDYPPPLPNIDEYEVTFCGKDDPLHPFNWSLKLRIFICFILGLDVINVAVASSNFVFGVPQITEEYHVGQDTAMLGVTLFVLGFAGAPIIYAPLSEIYGRQMVILVSAFGTAVFQFAVATGKDIQTLLICRFFGGLVGSAPFVVVPAMFADLFDTDIRAKAVCLFSLGTLAGPVMTPIFGTYITQHTTWRWLDYIQGMFASLVFVLLLIFLKETHHPTILVKKAKMMRKKSNNWGIHAAQENVELTMRDVIHVNFTRPLKMLFTEPVIAMLTFYDSYCYGILYLLLEAQPIIYVEGYGFNRNGALPSISVIVGMIICTVYVWVGDNRYIKAAEKKGKLLPELRLREVITCSFAMPIGVLWLTWTGHYHDRIHWIVPVIADAFVGFGLLGSLLQCVNYLIESYFYLAASALAANTFMRAIFGGTFILFCRPMFATMGTNFAGLLLGIVAIVLIPVPVLLYFKGEKMRARGKFAYASDL
ncbi:hypothetical protein Kpol_1044p21 [Vanderwaltozyma polyspora DSM 70294]|uniref:Major facilitator superfamily (MFS) profile domain-containing protein n=1 Tax=Vanderwaltozyma polyspora (strain ATCC 22028 / DSM 70294 / BCRC 21397 / CBS 2163 / NBRC 10782 / NRRL Y-8283 / UCD 57-17) TaxID=436907 RepID=A7TP51_VANPO|nr:uncharacterized protein Kpol_1044p21 [Vanderwaltozyma polyspora DSM 70294]EDO15961.1 hypothetical protein Kpol_1044p21 [Vanderwaltozyma polyspora DSM 70294]